MSSSRPASSAWKSSTWPTTDVLPYDYALYGKEVVTYLEAAAKPASEPQPAANPTEPAKLNSRIHCRPLRPQPTASPSRGHSPSAPAS